MRQPTATRDAHEICRDICRPLTDDQLRPLKEECWTVILRDAFDDAEHDKIGRFLGKYPQVTLTVSQRSAGFKDLRFLKFYPTVKRFRALFAWELESFDGIENLSPNLESLELHQTKSRRLSLAFLKKFKHLKKLYLEGHSKDFEVVSELKDLEDLTLRSITLPDLEAIANLSRLWSLDIKLGGTTNLAALSRAKSLKYLELWMVKGLSDITFISEIITLQKLFLQSLKNVTVIPHLQKLVNLRRIILTQMKGISDLSSLLQARSLEDVAISDAPRLSPEAFLPLQKHPALQTVVFGSGSKKKNEAVEAMFPHLQHQLTHPFIYR